MLALRNIYFSKISLTMSFLTDQFDQFIVFWFNLIFCSEEDRAAGDLRELLMRKNGGKPGESVR